jgi:hypothetical protein
MTRRSVLGASVALISGFILATGIARTTSAPLFHPQGRIVVADTEITSLWAPTPDKIAISTSHTEHFTTSAEVWDSDFLHEVLDIAGCSEPQSCSARDVSIAVQLTYAHPETGLIAPLWVDQPRADT